MRLKGTDILLLLLYVPGKTGGICEPIFGTTRLSKAFFLFEEEAKEKFMKGSITIDDLPEFIPWKFGPWSNQLMDNVEFFEGINFIKIEDHYTKEDVSIAEEQEIKKWEEEGSTEDNDGGDQNNADNSFKQKKIRSLFDQKKYTLTSAGRKYVEEKLLPRLDRSSLEILTEFKLRIAKVSLFTLLRYVYLNYSKEKGDWTRNSKIRSKFI